MSGSSSTKSKSTTSSATSTPKEKWRSPHPGNNQSFPYLDHDPNHPITQEVIDAATDYVMATSRFIHQGMDGKGTRFDVNKGGWLLIHP